MTSIINVKPKREKKKSRGMNPERPRMAILVRRQIFYSLDSFVTTSNKKCQFLKKRVRFHRVV